MFSNRFYLFRVRVRTRFGVVAIIDQLVDDRSSSLVIRPLRVGLATCGAVIRAFSFHGSRSVLYSRVLATGSRVLYKLAFSYVYVCVSTRRAYELSKGGVSTMTILSSRLVTN